MVTRRYGREWALQLLVQFDLDAPESPAAAIAAFWDQQAQLEAEKLRLQAQEDARAASEMRKATEEEKQKAQEFMRQMKRAREFTNLTIVSQMSINGEEADDVVGSYATKYKDDFDEILLVTTDKDYFQLLNDKTKIYNSGKNEFRDLSYLKQEYDLDNAAQWIDVGALAGESGASSDTIYGVPGIGYKTAAKLIAQYGTLDKLVDESARALAPDILKCGNDIKRLYSEFKNKSYKLNHHKKELLILAHGEIVELAKKLKTIRTFLDVEIPKPTPSWMKLNMDFRAMGLPLGDMVTELLTE